MRPLALVFACLTVVLMLAGGCGGQGKPAQPVPPPTPAPQEQPAAPPAPPEQAAPPPALAGAKVGGVPAASVATLYRDTYGVPHIYADTESAAAFAMGYAQAEDRIEDIFKNVRTALGTMAEAFGPEYVEQDYITRVFKNAELCENYWATAPEELRALGDSFVKGVEAYLAEHPEKRPDYAVELKGWHCAAIGRTMILKWPLGTLQDDLRNKDKAPAMGSNGWAVAPSRSADSCAILLTDPHLTWEGMQVFYEARVHAGDLNMNGFFLVGSPIMALGNNSRVGWACTTGGPDTSDVYMMKLNPANPTQYEYDGQWLDAEVSTITIPVKGAEPVQQLVAYTKLGPVLEEPDLEKGIAYCGATPYFDQVGLFEQMYDMCLAKDCDEFYEALRMNQFMEQNILFADVEGNIQYARVGRTPIRPEGYDWSAPVPGNTSATAWKGIHDINDLVQIKNPPQGYFQNCNISPALMMKDSPLTPDRFPKYVYNVSWDYSNPRGRRAVQLLDGDSAVTKEDAMAFAMDVYDLLSKPWQAALKAAIEGVGQTRMKDPEFAMAVKTILAWNGEFTPESMAGPLVRFWRLKCQDTIDIIAIADEQPLGKSDQTKMLDLLEQSLADMKAKYGGTDICWGDISVVGRGDKFFPAGGADFGGGKEKKNLTETLFIHNGPEEPKGSGRYVAHSGSMATMLMFFRQDGVDAYTCIPWGESADLASPHFMDQGEQLYSKRQFKPTWFKKEELQNHIESEQVLTMN